jgi:hypothetical protein
MAPTPVRRKTGATASWMTWATVVMLAAVCIETPLAENIAGGEA